MVESERDPRDVDEPGPEDPNVVDEDPVEPLDYDPERDKQDKPDQPNQQDLTPEQANQGNTVNVNVDAGDESAPAPDSGSGDSDRK